MLAVLQEFVIQGEEPLLWPIWFRAALPGTISLHMTIYYEMGDVLSIMRYRTLRMCHIFEVCVYTAFYSFWPSPQIKIFCFLLISYLLAQSMVREAKTMQHCHCDCEKMLQIQILDQSLRYMTCKRNVFVRYLIQPLQCQFETFLVLILVPTNSFANGHFLDLFSACSGASLSLILNC